MKAGVRIEDGFRKKPNKKKGGGVTGKLQCGISCLRMSTGYWLNQVANDPIRSVAVPKLSETRYQAKASRYPQTIGVSGRTKRV